MKDHDMNEETNPTTMRDCAFGAQDAFQSTKRRAERFTKCLNDLHKFDLDAKQSACVLEAVAIAQGIETLLAEKHVELQSAFVKLDEALAGEATRRR